MRLVIPLLLLGVGMGAARMYTTTDDRVVPPAVCPCRDVAAAPATLRGRAKTPRPPVPAAADSADSADAAEIPPWVLRDLDGCPLDPAVERWLRLEAAPAKAAGEGEEAEDEQTLGERQMVEELSAPFVLDVASDHEWRAVRGGWLLAHTGTPPSTPEGLRIDVAALRRRMGTLEVEVIRAETGARVSGVRIGITARERNASAEIDFPHDASETYRPFSFVGLPEGTYEIAVRRFGGFPRTEGESGHEWNRVSVTHATVRGGSTTSVRIVLQPPTRFPFRIRREDGSPLWFSDATIDYRDAENRHLELSVFGPSVWSKDPNTAYLHDVPPGRGWLVWKGNVWAIHVVPGRASAIELVTRACCEVVLLLSAPSPRPAHRGLPAEVRVRTREGVTVATELMSFDPDVEDRLGAWFELPPGAYEASWRFPTGEVGHAGFEVREGETDVLLELP